MLTFASSAKGDSTVCDGPLPEVLESHEPLPGAEMIVRIAPHTINPFAPRLSWLDQILAVGHRGVRMPLDDGWLSTLFAVLGVVAKYPIKDVPGEVVYETHGDGRLTLCWDATGCTVFFVPYTPPRFPAAEESPADFARRIMPLIDATKMRLPNGALFVPGWGRKLKAAA